MSLEVLFLLDPLFGSYSMHSLRAISGLNSQHFVLQIHVDDQTCPGLFMYTAAFQIFTKGCLTHLQLNISKTEFISSKLLLLSLKSDLISIFSISRNQTTISCLSKYLEIWEESFTLFFPLYRHIQLIAKPCQCCILI